MKRLAVAAVVLAGAAAALPVAPAAAADMLGVYNRSQEAGSAPEPVDEVLAAAVYIMKGTPVRLRVDAAGKTARQGHTAGVLTPHMRLDPPADGIYEMTFQTFAFRGTGQQNGERIEVLNFWDSYPPDLKGVRIYGARNCVEVFIHPQYDNLRSGRCAVAAQ